MLEVTSDTPSITTVDIQIATALNDIEFAKEASLRLNEILAQVLILPDLVNC